MKHNYIQIEQVNIHYVEATPTNSDMGKGHQGCIVFLHGFPEYWETWHAQLTYFSKTHRVIAPDLPGYNLSDKPKNVDFFTVPNLIQFMAKFIQQVAPNEKITLVAHDWGGAIAWPLVAFFPQLIERLIILNAVHPSIFTREMIQNPKQRQKSEYVHELIADNAIEKLSEQNFFYLKEKIFAGMKEGTLNKKQRQAYENVWAQPDGIDGMLQYYRAMPQLAPSEKNAGREDGPVVAPTNMKVPNIRIGCPTLILWGEQDQAFVKENLDGIEEYVPKVQVVRFPEASHWLQHELPNEVNQHIADFIKINP